MQYIIYIFVFTFILKFLFMKKLIDIPGELSEEGSVANILNIKAAKAGVSLTAYIKDLLIADAKSNVNK